MHTEHYKLTMQKSWYLLEIKNYYYKGPEFNAQKTNKICVQINIHLILLTYAVIYVLKN